MRDAASNVEAPWSTEARACTDARENVGNHKRNAHLNIAFAKLAAASSYGSNPFGKKIKKQHSNDTASFSGLPEGIRTPVLQNRNLLRYPAAPRAEILSYYIINSVWLQDFFGIILVEVVL